MSTLRISLSAVWLSLACACASDSSAVNALDAEAWENTRARVRRLAYPQAATGDVVDEYHGVSVADPYRWLEDADSPETRAWIESENALTRGVLDSIPTRAMRRERLEELWNYTRYSAPTVRGSRYFYTRNDGLQDQALLYVSESWQATGRVLLDPNSFSTDGTVALADTAPSPDGSVLAYATSDGGSDWRTWRFLDVASGEHLPDVITRNKFGGLEWFHDGRQVLYSRFERAPGDAELRQRDLPAEICLHTLGTDESEDSIVRERPAQGHSRYFSMSTERRALIVFETDMSTRNSEVEVVALSDGRAVGAKIVEGFDAQYSYVGNDGERIWIRTNLGAPNWRVVEIPIIDPQRENWREVVPEGQHSLQSASALGGRLVLNYLEDACSRVVLVDPRTLQRRLLTLPEVGSVRGFRGEYDQPYAYFSFTDFVTPSVVKRLHIPSGELEDFREPAAGFDPQRFVTRQVFFESPDGTRVPLFLVHLVGLELDGSHPTLLNGYGGFNISMTPSFSVPNLVWIESGGVYALAGLRGGGEYGEDWHAAGTKLRKQNVFDDFIAAAEWLVESGYTSPERLAISGGSNGGLLVGACMTQRPDLFGACLPAVGVMDMLRYHLFTIGWAWAGDYGTVDDEQQFQALLAYSPLHNLHAGAAYPATLVTTADRDDRVVPAHSFKFAARLQEVQGGPEPVLIRIETRAGHGAGKPTSMRIDEAADRLAFLDYALSMPSE